MYTSFKPSDRMGATNHIQNRRLFIPSVPSTLPAWRTVLLGTVAAGALMLGQDRAALAAPDLCDLSVGGVATCSGNQSDGITGSADPGADFDPVAENVTTLNVNNLVSDIVPAAGIDGIRFVNSAASITINSDTTNGPGAPFGIITSGAGAAGILADSNGSSVTIDHTGDITASGTGIVANAGLSVSVTSDGNIASVTGDGISAVSADSSTSVNAMGDITVDANGISAQANSDINLDWAGDITAGGTGISTNSNSVVMYATGDITADANGISAQAGSFSELEWSGNIDAGGTGIFTNADFVVISATGDITAGADGISAQADQEVEVQWNGGIVATGNYGIFASSSNGITAVSAMGAISSGGDGIFARAGMDISVVWGGNISAGRDGISVSSDNDFAFIFSAGNIEAGRDGILAESDQDVDVNSFGDILAGRDGISASSAISMTTVSSTGDIDADRNGIDADAGLDVNVTSAGNIAAGGTGISATSGFGDTTVSSAGNINAYSDGIVAEAATDVFVTSIGDIASESASGILADSGAGSIVVDSTGNIDAYERGIFARASQSIVITSREEIRSEAAEAILARSVSGDIDITHEGDISAANSTGISANAASGIVSVFLTGNIDAADIGISATGLAGIDITTNGGTIDGNNVGVSASSGNGDIIITNLAGGTITGGTDAIFTDSVTGTTINNTGTVTGNVVTTGGGNNLFDNQVGGLFNPGGTIDLGAGNLLNNAGTLSPGGVGTVAPTALTGSLIQTATGVIDVDVDGAAGTADRINVSETADLAGTVRVQAVNPVLGPQSNTIVTAGGGATDNGLGLVIASPALQASLSFPNANDVVLNTDIDFSPAAARLNENQTRVADDFNVAVESGVGELAPVVDALLNDVQTVPDYVAALDQLIPEVYLNTETAALFAAERFNDKVLSCPKAGPGYTAISQGRCVWLRYDGRWSERDGTSEHGGYEEDAHGFSGGVQVAVARRWTLGFAGAYEDASLDTDTGETADSDRYMLGGVIKYQSGRTLLALAGSVGTGDTDVTRPISIGGFNGIASSSYDVDHMGATFHAAYLMGGRSWYAKPFVDVNVTRIDREAVDETGGGAANLNVGGSDETYFSVSPALELGTTIDQGYGRAIRPYVRAGVTFYSDTDQSLLASFTAAPAGVGAFQTSSEFDDVYADLEAGLTLFRGEAATVSVGYEGRFSDDTETHGIFVKGLRTF